MVNRWNGGRRIAFVPVSNSQVDASLPPNFAASVTERAFYDPDPQTGSDRSLQAYIHTVSSGWAHIDGQVLPPVVANDADTMGVAIDSLPANHNFDYVVAVLPHSFGQHRGGFAWWDNPERNGVTAWARVALFSDQGLSMRQNIGVWAMEVLHSVTEFGDLYNVSPQPGRFDVMACSCGTHPSSHTKSEMGWIHSGAIANHPTGTRRSYTLHAVSLPQPPPPGRVTSVKSKPASPGYYLIEARLRTDEYEMQGPISSGIPSEGVVIYEVMGTTQVFLRASGLTAGQTFEDAADKFSVRVSEAVAGGFRISVSLNPINRCRQLQQQIDSLRASIDLETDIHRRKQLISALQQALAEFRARGCVLIVDVGPATEVTALFTPAPAPAQDKPRERLKVTSPQEEE